MPAIHSETALLQADIAFQANLYESQNPTRHWLHNARRRWVMHTLERLSLPFYSFFEVGVGCGVYTEWMSRRGTVTGIDINETFVLSANHLRNVTASVADITAPQAFVNRFDIALCSEVIEHLHDSPVALSNIYRALKPGGHLILTTPNRYSTMELFARLLAFKPVAKLARKIYGEPVDDLGHINRLTRTQLRGQIIDSGFEIEDRADVALYIPLIAEFGGHTGARICQWVARIFQRSSLLSHLLWTQCWVLRKPLGD